MSLARSGTTAFLASLPPMPREGLIERIRAYAEAGPGTRSECLGLHLEGPWLNPDRAGALSGPDLRKPELGEARAWLAAAGKWLKMVTLAPELPGALAAIKLLRRAGVAVSLGHSLASADQARHAARAGARLVTHVFNGMERLDHHRAQLIDEALLNERLAGMLIADGVHVSDACMRLMLLAKGAARIVLVSDNVARASWPIERRGRGYATSGGILSGGSGSPLSGVAYLVKRLRVPIEEAYAMASANPAKALGLDRKLGALRPGSRADCIAFNENFAVKLSLVRGRVVYCAANLKGLACAA